MILFVLNFLYFLKLKLVDLWYYVTSGVQHSDAIFL